MPIKHIIDYLSLDMVGSLKEIPHSLEVAWQIVYQKASKKRRTLYYTRARAFKFVIKLAFWGQGVRGLASTLNKCYAGQGERLGFCKNR